MHVTKIISSYVSDKRDIHH